MQLGSLNWMLPASGALLVAACASIPRPPATTAPAPVAVAAARPGDLAAGAGRTILQTHCTWCHDLREVTKFRGYYDRQQWRDIVTTMVEYGATLKPNEVEMLADYLTAQLGRR